MSDIVERLRSRASPLTRARELSPTAALCREAAAEIERLRNVVQSMKEPMNCECGFIVEVCATNPCMRKKVHLAGLTPGSKWPEAAPLGKRIEDDATSHEAKPFMMLSCREAGRCLHNLPGCICEIDPASADTEPSSAATGDEPDSRLPLQYEDGPDYCTVKDAQGRDFALTMQPELMQAMERALREDISRLSRPPVTPIEPQTSAATEQEITSIVSRLRNFAIWNNRHSHYEPVPLCKEAADLIERIRAVPQTLGQWQPIDTAPREPDAMFMVCAVGDARGPFVVRSDILWRAREAGTPSHLGLDYLTHWMPLPEMPQ